MIRNALEYVVGEMNHYLKTKLKINENKVVISGIVGQDGNPATAEDGIVIATLVNIHEEKSIANQRPLVDNGGSFSKANPPVSLNLYVLFSAKFAGSLNTQALRFLSLVVGFFQARKAFDPASSPGLDPSIVRLNFEIHNLNFMEQSNIWSSMGAKYMPSVMYKVRMLSIREEYISGELPMVEGSNEGPAHDPSHS